MSVGDRVQIKADGRVGVITALVKSHDCTCLTAFVRLERGEWLGKTTEIRRLAS